MAHQIEQNEDGSYRTFYVGEKPWHGLGIELLSPPTVKQAIVYAGLDWEVKLKQLYLQTLKKVDAMATVRETDNAVLGVVGMRYRVLQNSDAFAWFDPFVESGLVTLETAGSLAGGKRIWILAKIKDDLVIKGADVVSKYILLANGHDGTLAISAGYTPIRVVCQNTLSMATINKGSRLLKIRHTETAKKTLEDVRSIMDVVNQEFNATAEVYRKLANVVLNPEQFTEYVHKVFDIKKDEISTRTANQLEKIHWLWQAGTGNTGLGSDGTVWTAYNAIAEFLSYESGNSDDSRLNSLWFGNNANINNKALKEAMVLVA